MSSIMSRLKMQRMILLVAASGVTFAIGSASAQQYDIQAMGLECTQKIGVIQPFNCLDGEIIPITVNDQVINTGTARICDRPSFLAPAYCKPFSRVGRLPSLGPDGNPDSDVQAVFICRRYNDVTDPSDPNFKDVAIIQHRKSTGDTCFFQHLTDFLDATRVPPPAEMESQTPTGKPTATRFWLTPRQTANIGCNNCHDAGPFIHTPYIDQVMAPPPESGKIIFPFPNLRNNESVNYRFVGATFQYWGISEQITPQNNRCTECHVLVVHSSSDSYTLFCTGRSPPVAITDQYTQYPKSHWMPPDQAQEMPEEIFERLYGQSIDQILSCGARGAMESAPECNRRPLGP